MLCGNVSPGVPMNMWFFGTPSSRDSCSLNCGPNFPLTSRKSIAVGGSRLRQDRRVGRDGVAFTAFVAIGTTLVAPQYLKLPFASEVAAEGTTARVETGGSGDV